MGINLDRLFKYHRPRGTQPSRYAELRKAARAHADAIVAHTPESAEQTLAIRAVHQASMHANSAIAVNEPDADDADSAWRDAPRTAEASPQEVPGPSVPTRDTAGEWDHGRRLRPHVPITVACRRCSERYPTRMGVVWHPSGVPCPCPGGDTGDVVIVARSDYERAVSGESTPAARP